MHLSGYTEWYKKKKKHHRTALVEPRAAARGVFRVSDPAVPPCSQEGTVKLAENGYSYTHVYSYIYTSYPPLGADGSTRYYMNITYRSGIVITRGLRFVHVRVYYTYSPTSRFERSIIINLHKSFRKFTSLPETGKKQKKKIRITSITQNSKCL